MQQRWALACLLILLGVPAFSQETPQDIHKKELPKSAVCTVCSANGESHGAEKPAAGVRYQGKAFYFCNTKELATFKKDPDSYLPPVLPRPVPKWTVTNLDGTPADALKGKVLLVDFWATWCAPCVAAMPDMQKLQERYAEQGFSVVGVSIDEEGAKKVKPFLAKRKFTYPILLDMDTNAPTWKGFGVHAIPAAFLVNREGQIVQQWTGKPNAKEIEKAVAALLDTEKKPADR